MIVEVTLFLYLSYRALDFWGLRVHACRISLIEAKSGLRALLIPNDL